VLAGPLCAHVDARPGQILVTPYTAAPSRALTRSSDWLEILWRSADPTVVVATLSPRSIERASTLARALEGDDLHAVLFALAEVLAELRAQGVQVTPPTADDDGGAGRFAHLLWQRVMCLESQPMAVDIADALGVSERHALRQTSRFLQRFHLSASSWRELMQCLRLEMGTFFMSAPGARTEDVSRFLGFRSPTSFCHAFNDAGLPSPQAVHRDLLTA
jgi:AraC-like DNA-binding protein